MRKRRRFAANRVIFENTTIVNGIVEIDEDKVVDFYELTEELAHTEWVGGTITLIRKDDNLIAYKDNKILSSIEY